MIFEVTDKVEFNRKASYVTQSWEWGEFRLTTPTVKAVKRVGAGEKVWQIFFHKVPLLPFNVGYIPNGPMPEKAELEEIVKLCQKQGAVFLKFDVANRASDKTDLEWDKLPGGKALLPRHTFLVDLTLSEEELLERMHPKTRYNIHLAEKKGVVVREENNEMGLKNFIKLLLLTEKRQGFYSHSKRYYEVMWKSLGKTGMLHILNAYVEDKAAASIMLFKFKDKLYYPYGGSDHEMRSYMAPQLLHLAAMRLGKKLGCKSYDLWGSFKNTATESDPWWGFYRLKAGLGGEAVDLVPSVDIPLSTIYPLFKLANDIRWKLL